MKSIYHVLHDGVQSRQGPCHYTRSILYVGPETLPQGCTCIWAIQRRVGIDGKTGASTRFSRILDTFRF